MEIQSNLGTIEYFIRDIILFKDGNNIISTECLFHAWLLNMKGVLFVLSNNPIRQNYFVQCPYEKNVIGLCSHTRLKA